MKLSNALRKNRDVHLFWRLVKAFIVFLEGTVTNLAI